MIGYRTVGAESYLKSTLNVSRLLVRCTSLVNQVLSRLSAGVGPSTCCTEVVVIVVVVVVGND